MIAEYIVSGKWDNQEIILPSISNTHGYINNNLNLSCIPSNLEWFTTTSKIIKDLNFDKLRCETTMNQNVGLHDAVIFYPKFSSLKKWK